MAVPQPAQAKALLVAMENTPGSSSLSHARREVAMLHSLSESLSLEATEPRRCRQDVISELPSCKIFHFAVLPKNKMIPRYDTDKNKCLISLYEEKELAPATEKAHPGNDTINYPASRQS